MSLYLDRLKAEGQIRNFHWIASKNAVAPYDFEVTLADGSEIRVEAKSTSGSFSRRFHISSNELLAMATSDVRSDLYRLYEVTDEGAKLRTATGVDGFARSLIPLLEDFPSGISVDALSVDPGLLNFSSRIIEIEPPEE